MEAKMTVKVSLDVVNFKKEMRRIEQEVEAAANMEISERVDYATNQLRIVTPVDTGKARSGWRNEKYKDIYGYTDATIINEVDYISELNRGHSKQAPRYFIEQVLSRIGLLTPN